MLTNHRTVAESGSGQHAVARPTSSAKARDAVSFGRLLTSWQRWLVQTVVSGSAAPAETGRPVERERLVRFVTAWTVEPIECIRALNSAVAQWIGAARATDYLVAAVDLEILMDRWLQPTGERVYRGIPSYLADGYTDLGADGSVTDRRGREKIKIDKSRMRERLVEYRRRAVAAGEPGKELLVDLYETVQREIAFDSSSVNHLTREAGDESILLSRYLDEGVGVCRHLSLAYQLCLQESGIPSRMVKGTLRLFGIKGKHAWNLVWLDGRVVLVDVTLPDREGPLILLGASQDEVYRLAEKSDRSYIPGPDQGNYYRYRRADSCLP